VEGTIAMSLRFQRIASHFGRYITWFYSRHPELANRSYAEQHDALMYDAAERADFYSVALARLGYETDEIVADAEPMQKQWAREHGVSYGDQTWIADITLAQVRAFRPEVLFASSWLEAFGPDFVRRCREACPSIKMVLGWVGESHPGAAFFKEHDLVLSCAPDTVQYFQSQGIPARRLNHAFEPRILERIQTPEEKSIDLGFIGQFVFGDQYHNKRVRLFYEIAQSIDVAMYGDLSAVAHQPEGTKRFLRKGYYAMLDALHRAGLEWVARRLPRYDVWQRVIKPRAPYVSLYTFLEQQVKPSLYGLEMYQMLAKFNVCLNAHGPSAYASNMRLYDATGVGTCMLTDWKPNLPDLFELDSEVVAYRSAEEAVEKARYLLDHPTERRAIAAAGQRRTLRDHTYMQRAEELDAIITDHLRSGHKVSQCDA
jgi:spore maturation protein CgeB